MQKMRTFRPRSCDSRRNTGSTSASQPALPKAVSPILFRSRIICRTLVSSAGPVATGSRAASGLTPASAMTPVARPDASRATQSAYLLGDAQRFQRAAVEIRRVVGRLQEDRVGRGHAIQLVARQRTGIVGKLIQGPAAQGVDPLARGRRLHAGPQQIQGLPPRSHAVQPHLPLPRGAGTHQVHVVVDEPGNHRAAAQVDSARRRAGQADNLAVAADAHDAVALDRHGLRNREAIVDCDHLAVGQDDVGAARARRRRFLRCEPHDRDSRDEERCRREASPVHGCGLPFVLQNVQAGVPVA